MKKLMLIANPVAGKTSVASQLINVIDTFVKADYDVTVVTTQSEEHLKNTVSERACEFDTVVCCGGDGTLNLTVNALCGIKTDVKLGYIPCGTTNDFAKSRGISAVPVEAAEQIVRGSVHSIDVGFFGEKAYVYVAAFGVFSDTSYATPRYLKQDIGRAAYLLEGVKSLVNKTSYHIKFDIDGHVLEDDFIYGMFTNTRRVGGFQLPIIKGFSLDDGKIDVTLIKETKNPNEKAKFINAMITQIADDRVVYQFRATSVNYECTAEIPWSLDGEYGGAFKSQTVSVKNGIVDMLY